MQENKKTNWPVCSSENLILGNPESEIAIITLWTPTKKITDEYSLDADEKNYG